MKKFVNHFKSKKWFLGGAVLLALFTICLVTTACFNTSLNSTENDRSVVKIKKEQRSVVLFYKDTCPDCQKIFKQVWIASWNQNVQFVNLAQKENRHYIGEYDLQYVPTFVYLKNGKEQKRYVGTNQKEIKGLLNEAKQ